MAPPGVRERLDAVRSKADINVEGAVLELDENLPALDVGSLRVRQCKSQLSERRHHRPPVADALLDEQVRVLRRIREAEKDRARLPEEEVPHAVAGEGVAN